MMKRPSVIFSSPRKAQFNLTAMIDVVFLLIIFFMLICQFIVQENYELVIPDDCGSAAAAAAPDRNAVTVSVFSPPGPGRDEQVVYAVRSQRYDPASSEYRLDHQRLLAEMTKEIERQTGRKADRLVHLRADKDLPYGQVQDALVALSAAGIRRIELAVFRDRRSREDSQPADE